MDGIKISVIISTFNRHKLLKRALKSLYCQTFSPYTFEIIVVDNNSTDETSHMAAAPVNPATTVTKYIKEEKQGISPARNRGVREAKGHIVAFLDDDAIAEPDGI
jgi:glycosyltransferase involved in cell wall biosynthesis